MYEKEEKEEIKKYQNICILSYNIKMILLKILKICEKRVEMRIWVCRSGVS